MVNEYKIPREKGTYIGMFENFISKFTSVLEGEIEKAKEEEEAYAEVTKRKQINKDNNQIHVHIHTNAVNRDPDAEVRNRGKVVFPAESKNVNDYKDHFPINDADQARNALARVAQYSSVPSWYDGSLEELQQKVRKEVKKAYPDIEVSNSDK